MLWGPLKETRLGLCITVTLGRFESKVFIHYNYCWGACESKLAYLYVTVAVGPLWKQGTLHIAVAKGGPRKVPRLPSLKRITVPNPDNDLIWEYEADWTRFASSDMRTFSPDVRL